MTPKLNRRRFLSISAATAMTLSTGASAAPVAYWTGHTMGAGASMKLAGLTDAEARPVFRAVEHEADRLERIFSLYRPDSQLVQLNETGLVRAPAPELLDLLSLCDRLNRATAGAFDPTLQPMWLLRATRGSAATDREIEAAQSLVGWNGVRFDTEEARLDRPGMALTLNGVAQGYVTDRIGALLTERGLRNVLIDFGEIVAMGRRPDGMPWQAGIAAPDGEIVQRVVLRDRAVATSSPAGTMLVPAAGIGHILDPRSADAKAINRLVSVSAPQAAVADGLSTAGCLMSPADLAHAIGTFPNTTLETLI
ncbi:FAD:protein FMN transferase [Sedimentitalea sp. JM2-8]|uniref:FAD:protein FMN transferase n=1 Tax=Sedimentitalea xiamensis TaxID=3050037 RepID=A0ABT7FDX6_9RHOB|nr:FAD:protein FMN transferase [Sedimentitalea xiamensis]MDK3073321.1 FAD:protein FMN transferase [Sedimentitalea xiamensis]